MQLITEEIKKTLPNLYAQEDKCFEAIAYLKLFTPDGSWTWYVTEFDGDDTFFGLVCGLEKELGYFNLSEIQQIRGHLGLPVERDIYFKPTAIKEFMDLD